MLVCPYFELKIVTRSAGRIYHLIHLNILLCYIFYFYNYITIKLLSFVILHILLYIFKKYFSKKSAIDFSNYQNPQPSIQNY